MENVKKIIVSRIVFQTHLHKLKVPTSTKKPNMLMWNTKNRLWNLIRFICVSFTKVARSKISRQKKQKSYCFGINICWSMSNVESRNIDKLRACLFLRAFNFSPIFHSLFCFGTRPNYKKTNKTYIVFPLSKLVSSAIMLWEVPHW